MGKDRLIQLLAAVALIACLSLSGILAAELTTSASRHRLTYTVRAEEGDPPQVALGIAMGAFRGMFVNYLWITANKHKEEGRFHDAMDLARAITRLQPRFSAVWSFHAWNMAYNISVTTRTPQERWTWVNRGIDLLRSEGVVHNPNDLGIHRELGWIFLHKIGGYTDDANTFYKNMLAIEWTEVLGPPPLPRPLESRSAGIDRYVRWLTPIAEAPDEPAQVGAGDEQSHALVQELARELTRRVDPDLRMDLLARYQQHRSLEQIGRIEEIRAGFGEKNRAMEELMAEPRFQDAWEPLLAHARRRVLIEQYNMEPSRMIRYTRKYGPLDWRHPAAHAVYWTVKGIEGALTRATDRNWDDFDFLNADRVVVQGLQELFRSGELYFDYTQYVLDPGSAGRIVRLSAPNPHFVEAYGAVMDEVRQRGGIFEDVSSRPYTLYGAGYENFMKDVIRFYYRRGQRDVAERLKDELGGWEWMNVHDSGRYQYFAQDLDDFIVAELVDRVTTPVVAVTEVVASLQGAYLTGLLGGSGQAFRDQMGYARLAHQLYFREQGVGDTLDPAALRMELYLPRDFSHLAGLVFEQMVTVLGVDNARAMYDRAPDDLKRYAYDRLVQRFQSVVEAAGGDINQVFPEPPGMARHRQVMRQRAEQEAQRQLQPGAR